MKKHRVWFEKGLDKLSREKLKEAKHILWSIVDECNDFINFTNDELNENDFDTILFFVDDHLEKIKKICEHKDLLEDYKTEKRLKDVERERDIYELKVKSNNP